MSKYLKLFETTSDYEAYINGGGVVLPNVSVAKDAPTTVYYKPIPPMNIITYEASAKLANATSAYGSGLHTDAFNTTIKSHTFENNVGTIEFNGDVTIIGGYAFKECSGLTSINIPSSVTSIGESAFRGCNNLTRLNSNVEGLFNIPNSVTSIGEGAFGSCSGLTSITIPDSVTSISNNVFQFCSGLTSVTIGSGVTSLIGGVFEGCDSLTSIVVDSANTVLDSRNNCNAIINTSTNELIAGCKNTIIPNSVTSIGLQAFVNRTSLTSITIPDSVTSIGGYVFGGCTGLTSVTIGSGVTSIDGGAFNACSRLTSIICNAKTAPTTKTNTFSNVKTGGTLYVPSGSTGYDVWMNRLNNWSKVEQ